ncbi:MAG: SGNH/GDSL hydrolase family protein [Burkholderiaceae bacterium]
MKSHPADTSVNLTLLGSLYAAELALLLIALSLYKLGGRTIDAWFPSGASIALVVGVVVLVIALALIGRAYVKRATAGRHSFGFTVAMNLISLALILIPLELALRIMSSDSPDGPVFGDSSLLPRSWERAVAHYGPQLASGAGAVRAYLVYDEILGWTVGAGRTSRDGVHFSSAEGLRAASPRATFSRATDKLRIAIVGDSFAFAEHVKFEESFGHLLDEAFGPDVEVLNFGVPGYGVDQSYLKLRKEVLDWKPDIVVLGFPIHDFQRSMTVYPFINWQSWNIPFSKPRLVLEQGELRTLNVPTIHPDKMFTMSSISQLPHLEHEQGYRADDWNNSVWDHSYVKRWLTRQFPRWSDAPARFAEPERLRLNSAILKEFIRTAEQNNIVPLLVFFPIPSELEQSARRIETRAQRIVKGLDVQVLDMTPCLLDAGAVEEVYIPGDPHYSALGNAAVAKCIGSALGPVLNGLKPAKRPPAAQ